MQTWVGKTLLLLWSSETGISQCYWMMMTQVTTHVYPPAWPSIHLLSTSYHHMCTPLIFTIPHLPLQNHFDFTHYETLKTCINRFWGSPIRDQNSEVYKRFSGLKKIREYYQSVCPDFFVSLQKVFVVKVMKTATKLPTANIPVETLWSIIDQDPFLLREW